MNWFYKHYKFATVPRGAILDIGSGSNPFWRANILMERFLEDDAQRPGRLIVDRPIVCGDIHEIPFVDNAFSFIHCSHILEHLDNPARAIEEMIRVSKSGYIETPSEIHEFLDLNFPFHRWAVSAEDDVIVFREKPQYTSVHPLIEALKNRKNRTWQFITRHHDKVNILSWFWQGEIKYRIERCDRPIECYMTKDEPSSASDYAVNPTKSKLKLMLGKLLSPTVNLYEILACPLCKRRITVENSTLICDNCNKKFPIINKIPMMVREFAS
jgi:uncharacterized protein YbaR (Trm112 family)/SAM-dependent methyltransferase